MSKNNIKYKKLLIGGLIAGITIAIGTSIWVFLASYAQKPYVNENNINDNREKIEDIHDKDIIQNGKINAVQVNYNEITTKLDKLATKDDIENIKEDINDIRRKQNIILTKINDSQ